MCACCHGRDRQSELHETGPLNSRLVFAEQTTMEVPSLRIHTLISLHKRLLTHSATSPACCLSMTCSVKSSMSRVDLWDAVFNQILLCVYSSQHPNIRISRDKTHFLFTCPSVIPLYFSLLSPSDTFVVSVSRLRFNRARLNQSSHQHHIYLYIYPYSIY